jgi:hypothetical protein
MSDSKYKSGCERQGSLATEFPYTYIYFNPKNVDYDKAILSCVKGIEGSKLVLAESSDTSAINAYDYNLFAHSTI